MTVVRRFDRGNICGHPANGYCYYLCRKKLLTWTHCARREKCLLTYSLCAYLSIALQMTGCCKKTTAIAGHVMCFTSTYMYILVLKNVFTNNKKLTIVHIIRYLIKYKLLLRNFWTAFWGSFIGISGDSDKLLLIKRDHNQWLSLYLFLNFKLYFISLSPDVIFLDCLNLIFFFFNFTNVEVLWNVHTVHLQFFFYFKILTLKRLLKRRLGISVIDLIKWSIIIFYSLYYFRFLN